jgi:hypothetical protein
MRILMDFQMALSNLAFWFVWILVLSSSDLAYFGFPFWHAHFFPNVHLKKFFLATTNLQVWISKLPSTLLQVSPLHHSYFTQYEAWSYPNFHAGSALSGIVALLGFGTQSMLLLATISNHFLVNFESTLVFLIVSFALIDFHSVNLGF